MFVCMHAWGAGNAGLAGQTGKRKGYLEWYDELKLCSQFFRLAPIGISRRAMKQLHAWPREASSCTTDPIRGRSCFRMSP